jgi:hypothetical protein
MLEGPILSTMLRLAAPTMIVLVVQTMVGIAETYFGLMVKVVWAVFGLNGPGSRRQRLVLSG